MKKQFCLLTVLSSMLLTGCNFFNKAPEKAIYQIIFKDETGKVIETIECEEGTVPSSTFEPEDTVEWDYSLVGWSKSRGGKVNELGPATQSQTYYAIVEKEIRQYDISFYKETGVLYETKKFQYNTYPSCAYEGPANDARANYTFKGWSTSKDGALIGEFPKVTGDAEYYAIVDKETIYYDITFYNENGGKIETKKYEYDANPECSYVGPASNAQYTYTFKGWSTSLGGTPIQTKLPSVKYSTSYYAVVDKAINKYTASFYDENGVLLNSSKYEYGATPSYTYNKQATSTVYYAFLGWSNTLGGTAVEVTPITSDVNYYAIVEERDPTSNIILDKNTYYNGSAVTAKGFDGNYKFAYTNASRSTGNHVVLKTNGTIKNSDIIKGAKTICVNFTGNLNLSFSSDNKNYCSDFALVSGKTYQFGKYDTYLKITATAQTTIKDITISYGGAVDTNGARASKRYEVLDMYFEKTSISVVASTSKQLEYVTCPSDANIDNTVTWSSSNLDVVTINQNGLITPKTTTPGSTATITATNKSNPNITASVTVTITDKDAWTIMMYVSGNDLESENGLATMDFEEILSVKNQPDDVNIIIQTGGAKSWASSSGANASYSQRWHVENKQLVKDSENTKVNMGLISTFKSFLEWGLTEYPAEKTGVILWNHGGAMNGVCYDEQFSDDSLVNSEVRDAVASTFTKLNRTEKLEFIGYDACLMAVQDIAEFNSQYFNYMVCSEESESGYGWDYDTWIDDLYAYKDTETILKAIVDGFIAENGGVSSTRNDQTLSVMNLNYMSEYKTAWENMASQIKSKVSSSTSSFRSLVSSAKHYADSDYDYYGTFDAMDFINKLSSNSTFNPGSTYINAVKNAYANLCTYSSCGKGAGNSNGLAMFFPISKNYQYYYNYSTTETHFTNWRSVCQTAGYMYY